MKANVPGVLRKSDYYFSSPSATAQRLYYYPVSAGHFFCDNRYHIKRDDYNSILVAYIINGSFTYISNGNHYTANAGETVILDCHGPHEYYATGDLEYVWLHFNGLNSTDMYEELKNAYGNIITSADPDRTQDLLFRIFNSISTDDKPSEFTLSMLIYEIYYQLLKPIKPGKSDYEESIQEAKKYIHQNIGTGLTVKSIAEHIHMSQSHFSSIFKKQTGLSPYDYVLVTRLNHAKNYLQRSDMNIAQIAEKVGFNSESNFIYFFTKNTGISPSKFRKIIV